MFYITLLVFLHEGKEDVFDEYENRVLPLLDQYNGKLLYRIRLDKQQFINAVDGHPYEVHILSFNSRQDFDNYKLDKERQSHAAMFREAVEKVTLIEGVQI